RRGNEKRIDQVERNGALPEQQEESDARGANYELVDTHPVIGLLAASEISTLRNSSTVADWPGASTIVDVCSSMIAGPEKTSPGRKPARKNTGASMNRSKQKSRGRDVRGLAGSELRVGASSIRGFFSAATAVTLKLTISTASFSAV